MGRPIWLLMAGVAVLLVAGVIVAVVASNQKAASYAPNSPEGTVQRYLTYLQNGEVDKAYDIGDLQYGPTGERMSRADFHQQFDSWSQTSHRVTLVRSMRSGNEATVTVDISSFSAGPLGSSNQTQRTTFTLVRQGKGWRITGPNYLPSM